MPSITRSNGDSYSVVYKDAAAQGADPITAAETVIFEGPALDFFRILPVDGGSAAEDMTGELGVGEVIGEIMQTIQTKGTVAMYQVEAGTPWEISVAVYPTGAWTAAALQTAVRALGTTVGVNNTDISLSTVTAPGFLLGS